MDEGTIGASSREPSSSSSLRAKPSFVKLGDRQVFTVEIRPGETTFVSWKKLVKDANKVNSVGSGGGGGDCVGPTLTAPSPMPAAPDPTSVSAHPGLESRIAPGQPDENEAKDAPPANRFSAVIEKIERLYMGKDSSDEEDLKDVPDEDQYDTEDSFIDDTELDEYFEVDNSAIKHDGFFVNRGKLERIEPTAVPNQQPKKRRRKDLTKAVEGDGRVSNKHVKAGKLVAAKIAHGPSGSSQTLFLANEHYEDVKSQHPSNATSGYLKKKSAEARMNFDMPSSVKVSNGSDPMSLAESMDHEKDHERPKAVNLQAKQTTYRPKDSSGSSNVLHQKNQDRSNHTQSKLQSAKPVNIINEVETSLRSKEKNGVRELPDLNSYPDSKVSMPVTKTTHRHKRDGSSARPKTSMLEKSIRELEKMVAESRPPTLGNQDTDASSQAIKRRLPQDIKLKLAKVARLAGREGRISKELINRLMSILGHLIQLRTLKRNMKDMIRMGMRAKEEKDDRFQQIKKEIVEMIKTRVHSLDLMQALERQPGAADDFQELGSEEKGSHKQKFSMDAVLEDKICDLYDLFVDGLDEDTGPQVRKLYAELAGLWPTGFMDNHGIKRAICQAKERRRAMYTRYKDEEKVKRKKVLATKIEETVRIDTGSVAQPQYMPDRVAADSVGPVLALASKLIPNASTSTVRSPSPSTNPPSLDRQKQEKLRVSSGNSIDEPKVGMDVAVAKKKVKRKPEQDFDESHIRTDKLLSQSSEDRNKSLKHASGLPQKLNRQSTTIQVSNDLADFVESK